MPKLIALDAGHGSDTYERTGGKGVPGLEEHDFNAAVVEQAKGLLEYNGFEVLLTQPLNEPEVSLQSRTDLANSKGADLLLSFHADYNYNKDAHGHWAFYWHTSDEGKRLAELWNEEITKAADTYGRSNQPCIPGTWTNFHMVRRTSMTAVLMEHAFMSNADDLKLLKSDTFRTQCAEAAAKAVCRYYGVEYKEQVDWRQEMKDAHEWVMKKGISDGNRPYDTVTREELWTMLYRISKRK